MTEKQTIVLILLLVVVCVINMMATIKAVRYFNDDKKRKRLNEKQMKRALLTGILVLLIYPVFSQEVKYPSKEENEYYKKSPFYRFKPYSGKKAKSQSFDYINVTDDVTKENKFDGIYDFINLSAEDPGAFVGNLNGKTYTLFLDTKLDDDHFGYWLNIEDGHSNRQYYLGITENYFYHI